jgi:hypothetical protein
MIFGLREKIVASAQEWTAYSTNGHSVYAERHLMATNPENSILFITFRHFVIPEMALHNGAEGTPKAFLKRFPNSSRSLPDASGCPWIGDGNFRQKSADP